MLLVLPCFTLMSVSFKLSFNVNDMFVISIKCTFLVKFKYDWVNSNKIKEKQNGAKFVLMEHSSTSQLCFCIVIALGYLLENLVLNNSLMNFTTQNSPQ